MSASSLRNELKRLRAQVEALKPKVTPLGPVWWDLARVETMEEAAVREGFDPSQVPLICFVRWSTPEEGAAAEKREREKPRERVSDYDEPFPLPPMPVPDRVGEHIDSLAERPVRRSSREVATLLPEFWKKWLDLPKDGSVV
jgi:hypothetical protein